MMIANKYIFITAAAATMAITPYVIFLAEKFNLVDEPGMRKVHSKPIPRIGGIAIFIPVLCLASLLFMSQRLFGTEHNYFTKELAVILGASTIIFGVGLVDDIRRLSAKTKFVFQALAALIVCGFGVRINAIPLTESFSLELGWLSWPLTIVFITGVTNAFNLIDGLDGLAAGIANICCGVLTLLSISLNQPAVTGVMLILWGCVSAFMIFNFNPAKIFLGDCGSLFLGFVISSSSVYFAGKSGTFSGYALPLLALSIPIFDTLLSMLRRITERRSMFAPDSRHFHHRLLNMGLNQRQAVIVAYLVTIAACTTGTVMFDKNALPSVAILACIMASILSIFWSIGCIGVKTTIDGLKRNQQISRQSKSELKKFEHVELYFRRAETFSQWWESVCLAAEYMGFTEIKLPVTNRDGSERVFLWTNNEKTKAKFGHVRMVVPIRDVRRGPALNLEVEIHVNDSLESAGRCVSLFARLIEEYRFIGANKTDEYATEGLKLVKTA
jgi:UDP-N-acetylmuramyl pentapeptide phosphotransferase/UDP-N-acetylglucosamine-1-phosphate transferase